MKYLKSYESFMKPVNPINAQDMMAIPTSVGKDNLKNNIYDFLYKNGAIWETPYDNGSYFITIGDPDKEIGFTIEPANPEFHDDRDSKPEGWKSGAYIRNGYILGMHNVGSMQELTDYLGLNRDSESIDDIDLKADIADYIVDWFLEHKEYVNH